MSSPTLRTIARCAALSVVLWAGTARAGDFLDLRLSFNVTDENVFVKPGDTNPSIPGPRIGAPIPRWGYMFYDNYDTRITGFENLTDMVLYKNITVGQNDYEGAFVLFFNTLNDNLSSLYDAGSYIKWTHWLDPSRTSKANVSVTAFPISSDLFRLGFSYKLSWGGNPIFFKANPANPNPGLTAPNTTPAPGARVQFANENSYAFVGAKTSLLLNQAINEQETIYGILAGGGYDANKWLRLEANGGYFYRGVNPIQDVLGKPVQTYGVSGQVTLHDGVPVGRAQDWALFKNDPSGTTRLFHPEEYPGGLSWLVASEATYTASTLQSADPQHAADIVRQPGIAADVNVRVKYNYWRIHADIAYQDLSFLLINVPSFVPFQALDPNQSKVTPEIFGAVGVDRFFPNSHLTLGATAGVEMPATFQGKLPAAFTNDLSPEAVPQSSTVVVRSEGLFDILPPGYAVDPVIQSKITAMLQFGGFDVLGELLLGYDNNITHLQRINNDPQQDLTRVFNSPWQLGFNLALQAKL